jgi:CRP-like cAMP-binding protein
MPCNHLIEKLPRQDRLRLLGLCRPVELVLADVLCRPGEKLRHVIFPVGSFISLVTTTDHRSGLEVGMIGHEGMLGAHVALDVVEAPLQALVQGAGSAWRVEVAAFQRLLLDNAALKRVMSRYVHVLMSQLASSAACLRYHCIAPRLARWLLMSQDRARSDDFRVTQELLAFMLGVRRVGVTVAAGALQDRGLIRYARGHVHVLDRGGLESAACSCYAADAATYAHHLD